jgi:hypothetical protein
MREEYFLALLQMGLPPSEQDRLTVSQFDGLCLLIDQRNASKKEAD